MVIVLWPLTFNSPLSSHFTHALAPVMSSSQPVRLFFHCNASYNHSKPFINWQECPQPLVSKPANSNSQPRLISGQISGHQSNPMMYCPCSECLCLSIIWTVITYELGFYDAWTAPTNVPPWITSPRCRGRAFLIPWWDIICDWLFSLTATNIFSWQFQCNSDPLNDLHRITS